MMIQTLADALAARGYETLTPVQEAVSDAALVTNDLLVSAQTGSGKTVGFGLAIAPTILNEDGRVGLAEAPLALVIAPTRELALQVMRELNWLYGGTGARLASCVGGMDMRDEVRTLSRGAHIVVGTPGRLHDHLRRGSLDLTGLRAVVLDEADEMLDLGFREDLEVLLGAAPETRRTLMFSATVPAGIEALARTFQKDAVRLKLQSAARQHADIKWQAVQVDRDDAEKAIINLLLHHDAQNAIVFANTRMTVARLAARLQNRGLHVVALSGELSQKERTHALQSMRDGRARICVATDVAARGIDLPNLDLVIHAELPTSPDVFLHRSGRTGRAGRKGVAVAIVSPRSTKGLERLLKAAKVEAEWVAPPTAEEIRLAQQERLLTNPLWSQEVSAAEAEFAARLLALYSPEVIAAGWLREHQRSNAAPEDLIAATDRATGKDRPSFGPSFWVSLSVGVEQQASPRWLLPMILRSTGLDRGDIGAIRVQDRETNVEIALAAMDRLKAGLASGGVIEQGIVLSLLDAPPAGSARPPRPRSSDDAPGKFGKRPPRAPWDEGPRPPREASPRPLRDESRPAWNHGAEGRQDQAAGAGKEAWAKPRRKFGAERDASGYAGEWHPDGRKEPAESGFRKERPAPEGVGIPLDKVKKPHRKGPSAAAAEAGGADSGAPRAEPAGDGFEKRSFGKPAGGSGKVGRPGPGKFGAAKPAGSRFGTSKGGAAKAAPGRKPAGKAAGPAAGKAAPARRGREGGSDTPKRRG